MAKQYTQEEISKILVLLAMNAGNVNKTSKEVREEYGEGPSPTTLTTWRDRTYSEEYARIRDEYAREFEADAVRTYRDRMRQAAEAEALAIENLVEQLQQKRISNKDLGAVASAMSRIKASNADQLLTLTGRPTQIIDDRSAQDVIQGLVRRKVIRLIKDDEAA